MCIYIYIDSNTKLKKKKKNEYVPQVHKKIHGILQQFAAFALLVATPTKLTHAHLSTQTHTGRQTHTDTLTDTQTDTQSHTGNNNGS